MDLRETVKVLAEVHRLAHDRPTKDVLPIIHKITEPWHTHAALAGHPAETDDDYVVRFPRDALARPAPAEPPVAALRAAFVAGAKYEHLMHTFDIGRLGEDEKRIEAEAARRHPDPPVNVMLGTERCVKCDRPMELMMTCPLCGGHDANTTVSAPSDPGEIAAVRNMEPSWGKCPKCGVVFPRTNQGWASSMNHIQNCHVPARNMDSPKRWRPKDGRCVCDWNDDKITWFNPSCPVHTGGPVEEVAK